MATKTVVNPTSRGLGTSDTASLSEQFPATPDDFDPVAFIDALLDGVVSDNPSLGSFSMDYAEAPQILDFVPNPTPPGPGDTNPNNKPPAPTTNFPPDPSGFGSSTSPIETSPQIAEQNFDDLIPGKSSPTP